MGHALATAYRPARQTFEEADDILGVRLARLMWEGPEEELVLTMNAQPAILTHSIAVLRLAEERLGPASMAAGHSLGEYSAHVAAGTLGFAEALRTVRLRGRLMGEAGRSRPGTMSAILGLDDGDVQGVCEDAATESGGVVVPANLNAPGQVVISGDVRRGRPRGVTRQGAGREEGGPTCRVRSLPLAADAGGRGGTPGGA